MFFDIGDYVTTEFYDGVIVFRVKSYDHTQVLVKLEAVWIANRLKWPGNQWKIGDTDDFEPRWLMTPSNELLVLALAANE